MRPEGGGVWSEAVLHYFGARGDGITPQGAPVLDAAGYIYGATAYGGAYGYTSGYYGYGTMFEIVPPPR